MGAAIPVVGAVVGGVQAVSGLNAQKKQANAQKAQIDAQSKQQQFDTKMRLIELERQKMYAGYSHTIDTARRAQVKMQDDAQLSVAQQKDQLETTLANAQNDAQRSLADLSNQSQFDRQEGQGDLQYRQGLLSNELGLASGQSQLDAQSAFGAKGLQSELLGNMFGADLSEHQGILDSLGLDQQAAQTDYQYDSQANQAVSGSLQEGIGVIGQVVQSFIEQGARGKQRASGRAQAAAMAGSQGVMSRSDAALQSGDIEGQLDELVAAISQGGDAVELASARLGLSEQEAASLRNLGQVLAGGQRQQAEYQRQYAGSASDIARLQAQGQFGTGVAQQAVQDKLGRLGLQGQYNLSNLDLKNQREMETFMGREGLTQSGTANSFQYQMNQAGIQNAYDMNRVGMETYRSSRDVQFGIEQAQAELQKQFYDTALSSSSNQIKADTASQLASLSAQRDSIRSPGALSYLTAVGGAGYGVYNAIQGSKPSTYQAPQQAQQYQPGTYGVPRGGFISSYGR